MPGNAPSVPWVGLSVVPGLVALVLGGHLCATHCRECRGCRHHQSPLFMTAL